MLSRAVADWRARVRACSDFRSTRPDCSLRIDKRRRRRAVVRRALNGDGDDDVESAPTPPTPPAWFLLDSNLWQTIQTDFPRAPWGPSGLLRVAGFSLAAAAAFAAADALLVAPSAALPSASPSTIALAHLAREGMLAALLPGAVFLALKPDLDRAAAAAAASTKPPRPFRLSASWSGPDAQFWLAQALLTAAIAFPLAEPVLSSATAHALDALSLGGDSDSGGSFAQAVRAAAEAGDWPSVGAHAAASALLAPIWEEVFWRGFFLASLARVLAPRGQAPVAVGVSAVGFAALHLSARAAPPLALLGACCDLLYLRSGGNLAAPLLLHGLWNFGQVAVVALGVKDGFL
jgi:membrane protease YdiL (CAAX protease family)